MSTPYIGEIRMVGFNFAPQGWAFCDGSILPISQYNAFFNLIGTTYGGDGQQTFALPDLRSRVPLHMGTGPGGFSNVIGQTGGTEAVTLNTTQISAHSHTPLGTTSVANSLTPGGKVPGRSTRPVYAAGATTPLAAGSVGSAGGGQPHTNIQPFLAINFIISLFGVFPSQN